MNDNPAQDDQTDGSGDRADRRGFLRMVGAGAAAVGVGQLAGQATASAAPSAEASSGDPHIALRVVDYVDRHYVLAAVPAGVRPGMWDGRNPLRLSDGLRIELTKGRAEVRQDKYTGAILLKPGSGEVVEARAVAEAGTTAARLAGSTGSRAVAGEPTAVGYDAGAIPAYQLSVVAAGGGACASMLSSASSLKAALEPMTAHLSEDRRKAVFDSLKDDYPVNLRVRATVLGNVIPVSPTERQIQWRHARYYGVEDILGLLRFTYDAQAPSVLSMKAANGADFFPSQGLNSIHCRIEMLDLGLTGLTSGPMLLPSESLTWPPYSTPMHLSQPVTFYDEHDSQRPLLTVNENTMSLYDYNGLTIKKIGSRVHASGRIDLAYEVTNQTDSVMSGRWVLIGDHTDTSFAHTDAAIDLGPAGSANSSKVVEIQAPVRKSELSQTVAFGVMSLTDPMVVGVDQTTFKFPNA
ncbi:hypothetical protein ADK67_25780 [Saccharothrix sp. NRRL B-16348]|uniref:hypothetical protein n=1 Tax=Saccharothrix sp. NRRL B-16348 TaxID=1415542 RepID=UPI0006AF9140|nr:hypothetical protein [Saccharothrix sp. NRRL B-16348]KOX21761.1 hypothetical protein ADK67_25780 [Saccharothrix sp. NRRL B-16348]